MASSAYLILAHGMPYQTIDLLWSIWRPEDQYFVHIDGKSPPLTFAALYAVAASRRNVHVVPSELCSWGGFSLADAAWRCLQMALVRDEAWSHAVLISSTHVPLSSATKIAESLEEGVCYFPYHRLDFESASANPDSWWGQRAQRLTYTYIEVPGIGIMRGPPRVPPADVGFYWGSQWWVLSRRAAEFLCTAWRSPLCEYFRNTSVPDEHCFQTLLLNSPLKSCVKKMQTVWQRWGENGRPSLLSTEDLRCALASSQLFARKTDEATMRDREGMLAAAVGASDHAIWSESVISAMDRFMPAGLKSVAIERYRSGCDGSEESLPESRGEVRNLMSEVSDRVDAIARRHRLSVEMYSQFSGIDGQAMLTCSFPGARTAASYALILRVCRMHTAWVGLYMSSTEPGNALADLRAFPEPELIDYSFPVVGGLHPYRDFLKLGLKRLGIVSLQSSKAMADIERAIRVYLGVVNRIPRAKEAHPAS